MNICDDVQALLFLGSSGGFGGNEAIGNGGLSLLTILPALGEEFVLLILDAGPPMGEVVGVSSREGRCLIPRLAVEAFDMHAHFFFFADAGRDWRRLT